MPVQAQFITMLSLTLNQTEQKIHIIIRQNRNCSGVWLGTQTFATLNQCWRPGSSVGEALAYWSSGPSSILTRGEIFSTVNGVPLHTAFHYHPNIVLIWLKTVKKDVKSQVIHASIESMLTQHTCTWIFLTYPIVIVYKSNIFLQVSDILFVNSKSDVFWYHFAAQSLKLYSRPVSL